MMKKITFFMFTALFFGLVNAQTEYIFDYDGYDESEGLTSGYSYTRYIWPLNTSTVADWGNMQWATVDFDQLVVSEDGATYTTLPSTGTYTITVDSVLVYYNYAPEKDTVNDITFSIYDYDDLTRYSGAATGPVDEVSNPVSGATPLYTESLDEDDLTISTSLELLWIYPNLTLNADQNFSIYMKNVSDTLDAFSLLAGFNDACGGSELGIISSAPYNSASYMNYDATTGAISPNLYTWGTNYTCDNFYTQNWVIIPFVTINSNEMAVEATTTQLTDLVFCPGMTTTLEASVFGGSGNYSYSWSPSTGLSSTSGSQVFATIGEDDVTYTVTVTDLDNNVDSTAEVTILSIDLNVVAPGPELISLGCDEETNVLATATSEGNTSVFNVESITWTGGNANPLQVSEPGEYVVTAVDNFGCIAYDTVTVEVSGYNEVDFVVSGTLCSAPSIAEIANTSERTAGWNFTWYVMQNGDTLGIPGGTDFLYQFTDAGTYQIALVGDSSSCEFSKLRTVTVTDGSSAVCGGVNISDVTFDNYSVYPNPASDVLNVAFTLQSNEDVEVSVVSMDGKVIESLNFNDASIVDTKINTASMNNGIYILKIKTEQGLSTQKFVVSHR